METPPGNASQGIHVHSLALLQRLSLRRQAQTVMVDNDTVAWIVKVLLSDVDVLSEFSLEFGTALLMNLALRTSGKVACEQTEGRCLNLLNDLMEHENTQVRTHVNGTLYSLLSRYQIQQEAHALGLKDAIEASLAVTQDKLYRKQLEYLLAQLGQAVQRQGERDHSSDEEDEED